MNVPYCVDGRRVESWALSIAPDRSTVLMHRVSKSLRSVARRATPQQGRVSLTGGRWSLVTGLGLVVMIASWIDGSVSLPSAAWQV